MDVYSFKYDSLSCLTHKSQEVTNPTLNPLIPALIGAFVALLIGIGWDRMKVWLDLRNHRLKKLIYLASCIKPVLSYSKQQYDNLKKFAQDLKNAPLKFGAMPYSPKISLEKVVKLDEEYFFDAFTSRYKPYSKSVRSFHAITSNIQFQNMQLDQVLEMLKVIGEEDYRRKKEFQENLAQAFAIIADSIANSTLQAHPNFSTLLITQQTAFLQNRVNEFDLESAYVIFIMPVLLGIDQGNYYTIPIGLEIANKLHNARRVYNEIETQNKIHADDLDKISDLFKSSLDKLNSESSRFLVDYFDKR